MVIANCADVQMTESVNEAAAAVAVRPPPDSDEAPESSGTDWKATIGREMIELRHRKRFEDGQFVCF